MAKTQTITIPSGLENLQAQSLEQRDRFVLGVVQSHKSLPTRATKERLRRQSIFSILSPFWRQLTADEKSQWAVAGATSGLSNWQTFISENAGARRHGVSFPVSPSVFHTGNIGYLFSALSSGTFHAFQAHPKKYQIAAPIPRKRWKSELKTITEPFSFPLELKIRYLLTVLASGDNPSVRFFARVRSNYQGRDIVEDHSIDLVANTSWEEKTLRIDSQLGYLVSYSLHFESVDTSCFLYFDNLSAAHSGTNWLRDPKCNQVNRRFIRGFSVVPPYWTITENSLSATFFSSWFNFDS